MCCEAQAKRHAGKRLRRCVATDDTRAPAWTRLALVQIELDDASERGLFSGPTALTVPANTQAPYPLLFAPPWIGTFAGTLTLAIPATLETSTYRLTGRGLEPAASGHVTVRRSSACTCWVPLTA